MPGISRATYHPLLVQFNVGLRTWTAFPSAETEFFAAALHRTRADLSLVRQARMCVNQSAANIQGAGAFVALQYSVDKSEWSFLNPDLSGPSVELLSGGPIPSGYVHVIPEARTLVYLRVVAWGGSGTNGAFGQIAAQFR